MIAICTICLLWIGIALVFIFQRSQKILTLNQHNRECRTFNGRLGFPVMEPLCTGARTIAGKTIKLRFNNLGLPSSDITEKNPKKIRVLFLGGSTTVGLGVDENNFVQRQFQGELQKNLNPQVEFINASVEGFTTAQHALMLRHYLHKTNPDIVVAYTASGYKVFKDAVQFGYLERQGAFYRRLKTLDNMLPRWLYLTVEKSEALTNLFKTVLENMRYLQKGEELIQIQGREQMTEALLQPTYKMMTQMQNTANEYHAKFYVLVDKLDVQNLYPEKIYDVETIDLVFSHFSPELIVKNDEVRRSWQKQPFNVLYLDSVFTKDDYQSDTIYFNKNGLKKFGNALSLELARVENKK